MAAVRSHRLGAVHTGGRASPQVGPLGLQAGRLGYIRGRTELQQAQGSRSPARTPGVSPIKAFGALVALVSVAMAIWVVTDRSGGEPASGGVAGADAPGGGQLTDDEVLELFERLHSLYVRSFPPA